jgi:hypothetical protein
MLMEQVSAVHEITFPYETENEFVVRTCQPGPDALSPTSQIRQVMKFYWQPQSLSGADLREKILSQEAWVLTSSKHDAIFTWFARSGSFALAL